MRHRTLLVFSTWPQVVQHARRMLVDRRHQVALLSGVAHVLALFFLRHYTFSLPGPDAVVHIVGGESEQAVSAPEILETMVDLELPEMPAPAPAPSVSLGDPVAGVGPALAAPQMSSLSPAAPGRGILEGFGERAGGRPAAGQAAEFCGVRATGETFVFLVDSSKSMSGGRFEAAVAQLFWSLERFTPQQRFYVIFFDGQTKPMQLDGPHPAPAPVPATPENLQRLRNWISTVTLEQGTNPAEGLTLALNLLPDAVFLLSDGQFGGKTEAYLRTHNRIDDPAVDRPVKVVIHTLGFYSREGESLLARIARENGGVYRFVPKPESGAR